MTGRIRLTTAALLATLLAATPAFAQTQVQGGAAHDANQQVGAGGYNAQGQQVDYRARNLLVTGNVGGGRAFRGTINYGAEGAFRGTLGSDSLFNFNRDSVFSAPGAPNLQARPLGNRVVVTRSTTNAPGLVINQGASLSTRTSFDPTSGVLTFRQSGGGLVSLRGVADPGTISRGSSSSSIGLVRTPDGVVSINASPLTGIRYNPLDASNQRKLPNFRSPNLLDGRIDRLPGAGEKPDLNPASVAPSRRVDGSYKPTDTNTAATTFNLREDPLAITLGTQVQSAMALKLAGREDNNLPNAQAQAIREKVFGPKQKAAPTEAPKAPENPYDKLIADILAQSKGKEKPDKPESDNPLEWESLLKKPEDEKLESKRKSREAAIRLSLGMVDELGNIDYDTPLPTVDPDSDLGKLIKELNYDLPRLRSLAGDKENRINKLMRRGEKELKDGKYLLAETVYRQVLREAQGNDPLAQAGLVHSQMGAGMIRSAAFNLRDLFSDHPELIALRYDAKLMPDNERLRWLQGRLQTMIDAETHGSDPGLVLAYLGYQLDAKPLIEFGLDVATTEAPRDPLMPVLRRIWLSKEQADK